MNLNYQFWSKIEDNLCTKVPNYIKNGFEIRGFRDALTFQKVGKEQIDAVEVFIRTQLPGIIAKWKTRKDKPPIDEEDFFGEIYVFNPSSFELTEGDRIQISEIVAYVKKMVLVDSQFFKTSESGAKTLQIVEPQINTLTAKNDVRVNTQTHFLLRKLTSAADQNATRKPNGFRYDNDIKSYALNLRMLSGPLAYETLQKNLPLALPSLSSTNRYLQKLHCRPIEGILRSEELNIFLEERNLEKVVCLSEDATRIVSRLQYNSKTNQITGFALPLHSENGLPVPFSFPARNASEMMQYFEQPNSISSNIIVIMAQPIGKKSSVFCLMAFGSDSKYTHKDICNRWKFIIDQLKKLGITVLAVSSDSESRYNAAMRQLSQLGCESNIFQGKNWFSCGIDSKTDVESCSQNMLDEIETVFVQDTTHIFTKLRNLLLRTIRNPNKLPFGKYFINQAHLLTLITKCSKDKHNLTRSVLNPIDKQNFRSVQRICHTKVIELLHKKVKKSKGTAKFLQLIQYVIDSYMDKTLNPLERVYKLWYAVFILRIWRSFIISRDEFTLKNNFLSLNCYVCVELNAHSMVKCLLQLEKMNKSHLFTPYSFESQPCESLFRYVRALTTMLLTATNISVKEFLERVRKIQSQNDIETRIGDVYVFPRLGCRNETHKIFELPSSKEIESEIERAKVDALRDAVSLGLVEKEEAEHFDLSCKIIPHITQRKSKRKPSTDPFFS